MLLSLTSWLSRTVHGDFYGSLVRGHLRRVGEHRDRQGETLPCEETGRTVGILEEEQKKKKKRGRKTAVSKLRHSLLFKKVLFDRL